MNNLWKVIVFGICLADVAWAADQLNLGEPIPTSVVSNLFVELVPNGTSGHFQRDLPIECWWRGNAQRVLIVRVLDTYECKLDCFDQQGRPAEKTRLGEQFGRDFESGGKIYSKFRMQNRHAVMHPIGIETTASFEVPKPSDLFKLNPTNHYTLKAQFQCVRRDNWTNLVLLKFPPVTLQLADPPKK